MAQLAQEQLEKGIIALLAALKEIQEDDPELSDIHGAFEVYCMNKYSQGNSASTQKMQKTGRKSDLGIDFYSAVGTAYVIGQAKMPDLEWLESNIGKCKPFGPSAINDPRDAFKYLMGESQVKANESVRHLYTLIDRDRTDPEFSFTFVLIVFGRLNDRAQEEFGDLRREYEQKHAKLVLQEMDDLVNEFLVGSSRPVGDIRASLSIPSKEVLRAQNYCYFLANGGDLARAFQEYGWRLFDKNLRYEIRSSKINGEIVHSVSHQKSRRNFHHYNNGLIIVAAGYKLADDKSKITLVNPQIVNGLQTVKSLYNALTLKDGGVTFAQLDEDCQVQVKVITSSSSEFVDKIVFSTNNQNPMSQRNLKANRREQKLLKNAFASLPYGWFFQVKQGEWESLTQEEGRFFKDVAGHSPIHFRPDPKKKRARLIDNEDAAKAWLAFIGYADKAGDRVTHYFEDDATYNLAFNSRPTVQHWDKFSVSIDFNVGRDANLETEQADPPQYLVAFFLWEFVNHFIPSAKEYRDLALQQGHLEGKISKSGGSFTASATEMEQYLATSSLYQTWRVMSNMKELLVEAASQILVRKYGNLDSSKCTAILSSFEAEKFFISGDAKAMAEEGRNASEIATDHVFSRIFLFLHFVCEQFWEEHKNTLLAVSRIRTVLLKREAASQFKRLVWLHNDRKNLDRVFKPSGQTFIDSLPKLKV